MGLKIEVKEEEEIYEIDDQLSINKGELMVTMTKEESSLDVSTGRYYIQKTQHFAFLFYENFYFNQVQVCRTKN